MVPGSVVNKTYVGEMAKVVGREEPLLTER